jgi:CheY-like chemotaxis protein
MFSRVVEATVTAGHLGTVLIVDDDDADALLIEEALHAAYPSQLISRVGDGQRALDYLRRRGPYTGASRPDLILLDLNMPRVGGHEVLTQIKNDPGLKTIPVVVLTTSDAASDILASYTQHANAFVTKPFDLDSFETAVQQIGRFFHDVAALPAHP